MSQFLAEVVSDAMVSSAARLGVRGTAHIATPSYFGLHSNGYDRDGEQLW